MEKVTETWVTPPDRPVSTTCRDACLVHIYPTGIAMGTRHLLNREHAVMGRGDCGPSVVRARSPAGRHRGNRR